MTNELTIFKSIENPVSAAVDMGNFMADSGMLGLPNKAAGAVCALTCMAEGITPFDFAKKYHIIKNRLCQKADSIIADFVNAGGEFAIIQNDPEACEVHFAWKGNKYERRLTWEDAQQARWPWKNWEDHSKGLKDNWATPLDREGMLYSRLVSTHLRRIAPELFASVYTTDEIQDEPGIKEVVIDSDRVTPKEAVLLAAAKAKETAVDASSETTVDAVSVTKSDTKSDKANDLQVARLGQLCQALSLPAVAIETILAKRDCKAFEQLTKEQADKIIEGLEAKLSAKP